MLKSKNSCEVTACSCRTKAESLPRKSNSRLWPCTWGKVDGSDGVKMPEQEDEEFFDASPSPIEGEVCCRRDDSSAATVAGRTKLYELLQHAVDDAMDVFYDVSENAESSDFLCENGEGNSKNDSFFDLVAQNQSLDSMNDYKYQNRGKEIAGCDGNLKCHIKSQNSANVENFDIEENREESNLCNGIEDTIANLKSISECKCGNNCSEEELLSKSNSNCFPGTVQETINKISPVNHIPVESELCNGSVNSEENYLETNDELDNLSDYKERVITSEINGLQLESSNLNRTDCESPKESNLENSKTTLSTLNQASLEVPTTFPVQIIEDNSKCISPDKDAILHDPYRLKVFDEIRPLISRSTSLKTGKTPPGTPSRKKIVRFADVLGLDLEDVRHIISGDMPNVPPSAYSDLVLTEEDKPSSSNTTVHLKDRQHGSWENIRSVIGPNVLYPTFTIPGQQPGFWDRVQSQGICLESVTISDFNVQCTCRVMNWGFNKRVLIRYTVNRWLSSNDIDASYVSGSTQNGTDSFTFNIFLPPSYKSVEFALRYEINGKEYWDNNFGKNYCLSCHSNANVMQVSMPSSPTWVHQFW